MHVIPPCVGHLLQTVVNMKRVKVKAPLSG